MKAYKGYLIAIAVTLLVTLTGVAIYASVQNQREFGVFTPFPKISVKTETKEEPVAFSVQRINDDVLPTGTEAVSQQGDNGVKTNIYKVTYKGKKEVSREQISSKVTREPKNTTILVGTQPGTTASSSASSSSVSGDSSGLTKKDLFLKNYGANSSHPMLCTYTAYSSYCT